MDGRDIGGRGREAKRGWFGRGLCATAAAMRRWLGRTGRGRVIALLALALFVRALVPSGWMPVATPDGMGIAMCSGQVAMPPMAGMHHGQKEHGGGKALPDAPCAFAGIGLAADTPPPPPVLLPRSFAAAPSPVPAFAVTVGQGLAAPPPPATGPPVLG